MSGTLYTRDILRLASDIACPERLDAPHGSASRRSRTCGSSIAVDVVTQDDRIGAVGMKIQACAIGQASAAILGRHAAGLSADELAQHRARLARFLKSGEGAPGSWEELSALRHVAAHGGRHEAILLPYDALIEAFGNARASVGS